MDIKFVEVQTNSTDGVIALFDLVFTVTTGSDSGRIVFVLDISTVLVDGRTTLFF